MTASLFGVDETIINAVQNGTVIPQSFTGTAGQTTFNLTSFQYSVGTNSLDVYINGSRQISGRDYTESSASSFVLLEGVVAGDFIDVYGFVDTVLGANIPGGISLGGSTTLATYLANQLLDPRNFPWLAIPNNSLIDNQAALQACIDYGIANGKGMVVEGVFYTSPISLNGSTNPAVPNTQWQAISSVIGIGRFGACGFVAFAGGTKYSANQFVVSDNNTSGVTRKDYGVGANSGVTANGIDISWIGGTAVDGSGTPSNQNVIENVFADGFTGTGIRGHNLHDSVLDGYWTRNSGATGIGIDFSGGDGGTQVCSNQWTTGLFKQSSQSGGARGIGFFNGLEVSGAGFNHQDYVGGQINANPTTGISINSTATAGSNATKALSFTGIYFPSCPYLVGGRFHAGIKWTNCHFEGWTSAFALNFVSAGGSGNIPTLLFEFCTFGTTIPVSVAGLYRVRFVACQDSSGNIFNSTDVQTYTPTWFGSTGNPTAGFTFTGTYTLNGPSLDLNLFLTVTATGALASGNYSFSLPPGCQLGTQPFLGVGVIGHGGTDTDIRLTGATATTVKLIVIPAGTTVSATNPFALAATDIIIASATIPLGVYP